MKVPQRDVARSCQIRKYVAIHLFLQIPSRVVAQAQLLIEREEASKRGDGAHTSSMKKSRGRLRRLLRM